MNVCLWTLKIVLHLFILRIIRINIIKYAKIDYFHNEEL